MTAAAIHRHMIPQGDREPARTLVKTLAHVGAGDRVQMVIVHPGGQRSHVDIPQSVMPAINELVALLAAKGEATVVDEEEEVTPEEAATLLGMSRPMVVHRIKQGQIPHRMVGTHHKLKLSDVLAFREREQEQQLALAEFGKQTDEFAAQHGL